MKRFKTLIIICFLFQIVASAQSNKEQSANQQQRGFSRFPELRFAVIPGAPVLSTPQLVTGTDQLVYSEGTGLSAPAFYDWDGDGLKDLLVGEFGSGLENGKIMGSFIRVFKNIGTEQKPEFTGKWDYARFPFKIHNYGTPYSIYQSCCIGFTPQFVDLNHDGHLDMVSGQYFGDISWFKGSQEGFLNGEVLNQAGNTRIIWEDNKEAESYWIFSSASFGDLTGDGKEDLVTGGATLRISKNVGTFANLGFASRDTLLDLDDKPLKIYDYSEREKKDFQIYAEAFGWVMAPSGDTKLSPYVVDWDNDGVSDLLVTNSYNHPGLPIVSFFKGIKTDKGIRFEKSIPLFTSKDGSKPFPGSQPFIFVCDWNNDGVNDLLIGASIALMKNQFNDRLGWDWEKSNEIYGVGKDPGFYEGMAQPTKEQLNSMSKYYKEHLPKGMSFEDYMTIKHVGYVYVMLGQPTSTKATVGKPADEAGEK